MSTAITRFKKFSETLIKAKDRSTGPSRESLVATYLANPESTGAKLALRKSLSAAPSIMDLVDGVLDSEAE